MHGIDYLAVRYGEALPLLGLVYLWLQIGAYSMISNSQYLILQKLSLPLLGKFISMIRAVNPLFIL